MSSSAVTQKSARNQQVAKPSQEAAILREENETSASGSASAGLNLNIIGAISGAFSGKQSKEEEADGSSTERTEKTSHVSGIGMGRADANAAANAEGKSRQEREKIMAS